MGDGDTFWHSGRAGGEEEVGEVVLVSVVWEVSRIVVGVVGVEGLEEVMGDWEVLECLGLVCIGDEEARLGVVEDGLLPLGGVVRIEW
jgi:hypothetical protein